MKVRHLVESLTGDPVWICRARSNYIAPALSGADVFPAVAVGSTQVRAQSARVIDACNVHPLCREKLPVG